MKERQLLVNKIQTPDGTILHSKHRHDYVSHLDKNGEVYILDGGSDYIRGSVNKIPAKDLSLYSNSPFEDIREAFTRGGYGKDGDEPLKWTTLKDMTDEHLEAIINYEELHRPGNTFLWIYTKEKEFRVNADITIK